MSYPTCRYPRLRYFWLAGSLTLLVACQHSPEPPATSQQTMHQIRPAEEKGQSGAAISDQDYVTTLGLMAGHLLVAQDLLATGDVKGADPHVGHPLAELYADVAPRLEAQTQVPLKADLNRCQRMIDQAQAAPTIQACVTQSLKLVDRAIALVPDQQRS
jgi:hypothetical protein